MSEGSDCLGYLEEPVSGQGIAPDLVQEEVYENGGFLARTMALMLDLAIIMFLQLGCLVIPIASLQHGDFAVQTLLASVFIGVSVVVLSPFIALLYFVLLHGSLGQTLGKMLMGLSVVSADGGKITVGVAFLRAIGFLLAALPFGAGLLWVLADHQGRGWHDYLAVTRVIRVN